MDNCGGDATTSSKRKKKLRKLRQQRMRLRQQKQPLPFGEDHDSYPPNRRAYREGRFGDLKLMEEDDGSCSAQGRTPQSKMALPQSELQVIEPGGYRSLSVPYLTPQEVQATAKERAKERKKKFKQRVNLMAKLADAKKKEEKLADVKEEGEVKLADTKQKEEVKLADAKQKEEVKLADAKQKEEVKLADAKQKQEAKLADAKKKEEAKLADAKKKEEVKLADAKEEEEAKLADAEKKEEANLADAKKEEANLADTKKEEAKLADANKEEAKLADAKKKEEAKLADAKKKDEAKLADAKKKEEAKLADAKKREEAKLANAKKKEEANLADTKEEEEAKLAKAKKEEQVKLADANKKEEAKLANAKKKEQVKLADAKKKKEAKLPVRNKTDVEIMKKLYRIDDDRNQYLMQPRLTWEQKVLNILQMVRRREVTEYNHKLRVPAHTRFFCGFNIALFDLDKESEGTPWKPIDKIPSSSDRWLADSVNVVAIKVAESDRDYPISVFGTVLARDEYDYRCVYLFKRGRDDPQVITSKDDTLTLMGPYRALAVMDHMYFEFHLKIKGDGDVDEDFSKGSLVHSAVCHSEKKIMTNSLPSCLSTVKLVYTPVPCAVEASFTVSMLKGPSDFISKVTAWTTGNEENRIVVYKKKVADIGCGGSVIHGLVAVPEDKELVLRVCVEHSEHERGKCFELTLGHGINEWIAKQESYELQVKISWKGVMNCRRPNMWGRVGDIRVLL